MSTLVVEVCEVLSVDPHPGADALEFITVKGWQVIVGKAVGLRVGQKVVYFPPDTVMPPELAEKLRRVEGDTAAGREIGMEHAIAMSEQLLIEGAPSLHFYTFNRSKATLEVLGALGLAQVPALQT